MNRPLRTARRPVAVLVAAAVAALAGCAPTEPAPAAPTGASASAAPDRPEEPRAERVDPTACTISFALDTAAPAPLTLPMGERFVELPLPRRDDAVFAGWYLDASSAAALDARSRVNIADAVACEGGRLVLHGAWTTQEETAAADVGVPILMYHQFTDDPGGVDDPLRLNWAYVGDFDAQMAYLAEEDFYLPSWRELAAFVDGDLRLPERSAIVTDDDAHASWFDLAVPVLEEHGILATSFVITKWRSEPSPSSLVLQRSHTHDMHDPGADGRGRMVNWTPEEIAADLRTSAEVLGAAEVLAYPFGHHDERSQEGASEAGFEMAVTVEPGVVRAGADPLALPRVRIDYGMGLEAFAARLG